MPLDERTQCVRAMADFFRTFVAPAAPGRADIDTNVFHIACYMWWDIFPSYGGSQTGEPELHQACLAVMREVLALPSELCQSAPCTASITGFLSTAFRSRASSMSSCTAPSTSHPASANTPRSPGKASPSNLPARRPESRPISEIRRDSAPSTLDL